MTNSVYRYLPTGYRKFEKLGKKLVIEAAESDLPQLAYAKSTKPSILDGLRRYDIDQKNKSLDKPKNNETGNLYAAVMEDLREHYDRFWEQTDGILKKLSDL